MNFKQKLTYMLIGSLFTLAGYLLASLANNQPPNVNAQDNKVIDEIVCKKLRVVNDEGVDIVRLGINSLDGGSVYIYNEEGKTVAGMDTNFNDAGKVFVTYPGKLFRAAAMESDRRGGRIYVTNALGKRFIEMDTFISTGRVRVYTHDRKSETEIYGNLVVVKNEDKEIAWMDAFDGSVGINNKEGKKLVHIGAIKDRPNDGLINIYDYKGNHRSYTAD